MGLLQKAVETYDANAKLIGVYQAGRDPLAPIGHSLTNADVEITLNAQGAFLSARKVDPVSRHRGFQRTHQRTCAASALRPAEVYCLHERKGTHALLADAARMDGVAAFAPFSAGGFLLRGRRFDPERPGRGGAFGGCGAL